MVLTSQLTCIQQVNWLYGRFTDYQQNTLATAPRHYHHESMV